MRRPSVIEIELALLIALQTAAIGAAVAMWFTAQSTDGRIAGVEASVDMIREKIDPIPASDAMWGTPTLDQARRQGTPPPNDSAANNQVH